MNSIRKKDSKKSVTVAAGVVYTVVFLLLFSIGSVLITILFLTLVQNPCSLPFGIRPCQGSPCYIIRYPFYGIELFWNPPGSTLGSPALNSLAEAMVPIIFIILQSFSTVLQMQLIFYPLLSIFLVIISVGLLRVKNWARILTMIYFALIPIYAILILNTHFSLEYVFFNINILSIFTILRTTIYGGDLLDFLAIMLPIILAIGVVSYLSGSVRHKFNGKVKYNQNSKEN